MPATDAVDGAALDTSCSSASSRVVMTARRESRLAPSADGLGPTGLVEVPKLADHASSVASPSDELASSRRLPSGIVGLGTLCSVRLKTEAIDAMGRVGDLRDCSKTQCVDGAVTVVLRPGAMVLIGNRKEYDLKASL